MGKAASLNGVRGDVILPNVVYDEHSRNTYLFNNNFSAADIAPNLNFGTVLDNQKAVSVMGTFLQNRMCSMSFTVRGIPTSRWKLVRIFLPSMSFSARKDIPSMKSSTFMVYPSIWASCTTFPTHPTPRGKTSALGSTLVLWHGFNLCSLDRNPQTNHHAREAPSAVKKPPRSILGEALFYLNLSRSLIAL